MRHGTYLEVLALLQVLALQRAAYDVHQILELRDSKIDPVVHHLAQGLEGFRWDVEEEYLRTGDVGGPVELVGLVAADDQNVCLVNDDNFSFANFFVEDLETRPLQSLKIIECVLVKLSKVKQLLRYSLIVSIGAGAAGALRLVHGAQVLYLLLSYLQLAC